MIQPRNEQHEAALKDLEDTVFQLKDACEEFDIACNNFDNNGMEEPRSTYEVQKLSSDLLSRIDSFIDFHGL